MAYTSQQNGVAERMNRTLTERIRVMLRTTGLPNSLWAESAKIACYIVNRSSSTAIKLKTRMEMWTGKSVDYSYLHAFWCHVYVMYNVQEITKLDLKSKRYIFLWYADGVKGYRLWDPTAHKIVISRDVIFIKDQLHFGFFYIAKIGYYFIIIFTTVFILLFSYFFFFFIPNLPLPNSSSFSLGGIKSF